MKRIFKDKKSFAKILLMVCLLITTGCLFFLNNNTYVKAEGIVIEEQIDMRDENLDNVNVLNGDKKGDDVVFIDGEKAESTSISSFTGVKYIPNANYFLINPRHRNNNGDGNFAGTCTTVAVQLLLGYHNYYSDRRIIPTQGNGRVFLSDDYGEINNHPNFERERVVDQGCYSIGTAEGLYEEIFDRTFWAEFPALGQTLENVKNGTINFLNAFTNSNVRSGISLTKETFSAVTVRSEIDAGRPVVLGFNLLLEMNIHFVVAYGYATLNGEDGFLVHYGWGDDGTQVWVPENILGSQLRMSVAHQHDLIDTGENLYNTHRVLTCSVCGYSTVEYLYNITNEKIQSVNFPLSGEIVIPNEINLYSKETASFTMTSLSSIGERAFLDQTMLTKITMGNNITTIEEGAFDGCENLSIILLKNVTNIEADAFTGCEKLTSLIIPQSVSNIDNGAFDNIALYVENGNEFSRWSEVFGSSCSIFYGCNLSWDKTYVISFAEMDIQHETANEPKREGYAFAVWYENSNLTGVKYYMDELPIMRPERTLYAKWIVANEVNIIYKDVGNLAFSGIDDGLPFSHSNGNYTVITNPIKRGYTFVGWYKDSLGEEETIPYIYPDDEKFEDIVLYAKWTVNTYTITYKDKGNGTFSGHLPSTAPTTHTYDQETVLPLPTKVGYEFKGWYTTSACTGAEITEIGATAYTEDIILYAKWQAKTLNVIYHDKGGQPFSGILEEGSPTVHTCGTTTALLSASKTGAVFAGWYTTVNCTGTAIESWNDTQDEDVHLYAKWITEYIIAYKDVGGEDFSRNIAGLPQTVNLGASVTLPSLTTESDFLGWYLTFDSYGESITEVVGEGIIEEITVYAKWWIGAEDVWDGTVAEEFSQTAEDGTIKITNGAELALMVYRINKGQGLSDNYELVNDIYLNDTMEWKTWEDFTTMMEVKSSSYNVWDVITSFPSSPKVYRGTFDGKGHTIYGLLIGKQYAGLIQRIGGDAEIRNLGIAESYCLGTLYGATIVGSMTSGSIINCYSGATVRTQNANGQVGGIVGAMNGGWVTNCCYWGDIEDTQGAIGGTAGNTVVGNYYIHGVDLSGDNYQFGEDGYLVDGEGLVTDALNSGVDSLNAGENIYYHWAFGEFYSYEDGNFYYKPTFISQPNVSSNPNIQPLD